MKIKPLEINLDVIGWDYSGGKSKNVWGQVPISNLPLEEINNAIAKNKKSCIWTCYDDAIYIKDENGNLLPCDLKNLPKTISATFKPTYDKFSAVAENLGMKIAVALDLPTSYNYIVKFEKEKHPKILDHIMTDLNASSIQPYGVVSIDFLKPIETKEGDIVGENLNSFADVLRLSLMLSRQSNNTLVEKWINSVDVYIRETYADLPPELLNKQIRRINSRIARSYILREFLGDCDFTELNSGIVSLNYAPNHDYGESFNSLIRTKFFEPPDEKILKEILKWDPTYLEKKYKIKEETLVESIAQRYAQDTSEQNIKYIVKNYPKEANEVLSGLITAIKNDTFTTLVDEYTVNEDGEKPLLSQEEAKMFKIYLNTRAGWMQNELSKGMQKEETRDF